MSTPAAPFQCQLYQNHRHLMGRREEIVGCHKELNQIDLGDVDLGIATTNGPDTALRNWIRIIVSN